MSKRLFSIIGLVFIIVIIVLIPNFPQKSSFCVNEDLSANRIIGDNNKGYFVLIGDQKKEVLLREWGRVCGINGLEKNKAGVVAVSVSGFGVHYHMFDTAKRHYLCYHVVFVSGKKTAEYRFRNVVGPIKWISEKKLEITEWPTLSKKRKRIIRSPV